MAFKHTSVLLEETIEGLSIRPDGIYVDGTLGGGGHSFHIASALKERGRLIGIDQDKEAIAAAVKSSLPKETWTFTLEDGTTVTKAVYAE